MRQTTDETHDPARVSWVSSANDPNGDFPIQNLPFGVFRTAAGERSRVGVAIGDQVLDLFRCRNAHLLIDLPNDLQQACAAERLNALMGLDRRAWTALRRHLSALLSEERIRELVEPCLVRVTDIELQMPAAVGDYTDFYASAHHATNVGRLFRPDNPLLPNYKHLPIGYHGRASSLVVSGTDVRRPLGQRKPPESQLPSYEASAALDYELEIGFFVGGPANPLGERVTIVRAEERIFGLCLVNDWSARDIQAWEYQPLGPFLSKSFATSVSPWVVTLEALSPFRCLPPARPQGDPTPLPYLRHPADEKAGFEIQVETWIQTERMRAESLEAVRLSRASFADMYWTPGQMLTHHASNGCPLVAGDLMASGTVSGPDRDSYGSMLEITRRGEQQLELPNGERRGMLEDGDEIMLRAFCEGEGHVRVGLGECRGRVLPVGLG